jgi:Double sensory domain of two-component sensor kinase
VTFVTVAIILSVVFIVLMVDARDRVRASEVEKLSVAEKVFTALEARRQQEQLAAIATVAENPTLKAALDTYFTESSFTGLPAEQEQSLLNTVTVEAEKLAALTDADVLAILDANGRIFVSAGPLQDQWPRNERIVVPTGTATFQDIATLPQGAFRISGSVLSLLDRDIGALVIGTSLDANYARELSNLASADVVITVNGAIAATTAPTEVAADLVSAGSDAADTETLNDEEYAVRTLMGSGAARIYTLASVDAAARAATRDALMALATVAFGAFVLAGLGSLWLA